MRWLLVDATYLCKRAKHSTGESFDDEGTGIAFGVIDELARQRERWGADAHVLAFDWGGGGLRAEIDPGYKASRRNRKKTPEEQAADQRYYKQHDRLRAELLPMMGYRNIWRAKGYEADDIIAAAADALSGHDSAVIVTADKDMWQCLRHNVRWHSPASGKTVTASSFWAEWGIDPVIWADVKALAGCETDDVDGVEGIGEKTAAKWFAGKLPEHLKSYEKISRNLHVHNHNLPLVSLPFPGLEIPEARPDALTPEAQGATMAALGIRSRRDIRGGGRQRVEQAEPVEVPRRGFR